MIASPPRVFASTELASGGLVESLVRLNAFLGTTLPESARPLVEEFIAGLPKNFPVNERTSFVVREFLSAGVVATADTVRETAARVFRDVSSVVIGETSSGTVPPPNVTELIEQLTRVLSSVGSTPENLTAISRNACPRPTAIIRKIRKRWRPLSRTLYDKVVSLLNLRQFGLASNGRFPGVQESL